MACYEIAAVEAVVAAAGVVGVLRTWAVVGQGMAFPGLVKR